MGIRSLALLVTVAIATPTTAGAALPPLARLALIANETSSGWVLEADSDGTDQLISMTLTPPGRTPLALTCQTYSPGSVNCKYKSDPPVLSLAALVSSFPAGTWTLTVNGTLGAALVFDPIQPNGVATVTAPADGAVNVGTTPSISYTHNCSNCTFIHLSYSPVLSGVTLEALLPGSPPAMTGTVPYASFTSSGSTKPVSLANGVYTLKASSLVGIISTETLAPGTASAQPFEWARGAGHDAKTSFTVPEPEGAPLAALASLAALVAARRRMRS